MIAYEFFTRVKPFGQAERTLLLRMRMRPPSAKDPRLSPEVDVVVLRCLRKDPRARFRNCEELHEELSTSVPS